MRKQCTALYTSYNMESECIITIVMYYKGGICMTTLYVTESSSFIKRKGGHVIVGRNHEVLFEVPFDSIDDVTVFDSVHISSSLLTDFISNGIPVT